jgi:hypothetical protein
MTNSRPPAPEKIGSEIDDGFPDWAPLAYFPVTRRPSNAN